MMHRKIITFALMTLLGACSAPTPGNNQTAPNADFTSAAAATDKYAPTSKGGSDMPTLGNVLTVFSSTDGASWESFNNISGVQWRDQAPENNPDATDAGATHYRSGNLLLAGFGVVEVPDGEMGADAGTKQGNEGNSGITLNGDANSVQSIVVVKFYPSENYQDVLQQQMGSAGSVKLTAEKCRLDAGTTEANTQKNMFYQVNFLGGSLVYVEAYVDVEGGRQGPGSTTFAFYKRKPMQRIALMRCQEV